jgi:hypothetical protein
LQVADHTHQRKVSCGEPYAWVFEEPLEPFRKLAPGRTESALRKRLSGARARVATGHSVAHSHQPKEVSGEDSAFKKLLSK